MIRKLAGVLLGIAVTVSALAQEQFITRYGRLDNVRYHIKADRKATITFMGGSITNMEGWRGKVCDYLTAAYPATDFRFINAGIPSLGSLPHAFRFEHDVLSKGKTDLLFLEAAVNDRVNGTNEVTQRRAMEGIIRHALKANPQVNIVLMAFVDEDKMADYHAGKVPVEVQVHEDLAKKYHLPFINLAKEITTRIDAREFTWKDDFKDLHPSPFGQQLYFDAIKRLLEADFSAAAPKHLSSAKLPRAADPLNYENGAYGNIHEAVNKNGFSIIESWEPADKVGTREGFVKVPMLVSDTARASVEYPFTGRTIGIGIVSGPDAGVITYRIDGGAVQQKDLRTQWSKGLYLPWYLILGDDLKPGKHTLSLQKEGDGSVCRVVYFLVN
ncbi:SGNH/GDSL hydrolase family protein [Chitinophaga ginsengisegetis]|uniref:SGNH/GDSL hydrolase family protein n=1 Tax=Chitinophaga ginsengisegetis TaxID=393003 RepID=UPI000DBA31BB|nr:SGNH/GDSL hydrolase family protein [Chitinophaga ginsengisegetis]MDR6570093.1 sialidase-1 [Chitinophaga ginsengisegetis]MDR6649827.1 sialidase-1 [Chitinophaga ginsengisegetis]MDR6655970.1 sialidase-1 [Chitinophaga ginsengisegetis]